jgi:hypothetical protein
MVPAPIVVRNMLSDLLGRDVAVTPANPVVTDDLPTTVLAVYVDDATHMTGVIGLDLPLAAFAGAALGLVPAGGAEDCVKEKSLSPMLVDNVRELCNVLTGLLSRGGHTRNKLHRVYVPGEDLPSDAAAQLLALGQRLDLTVGIPRYGDGRFSLSLAA